MGCFEVLAGVSVTLTGGDYFVDPLNGTDDILNGGASGVSAWKTIHYAVDLINSGDSGVTYTLNIAPLPYLYNVILEDDAPLIITQDNVTIQGYEGRAVLDGAGASNWDVGIEILGSSGVTIQNLQIQNFSELGIGVADSSPLIQKNILDANSHGIGIYASSMETSPHIWNNLITSSTYTGIEVLSDGPSSYPEILHNTIDGSGYEGIYLDNYYGSLVDPTIAGNIISNSGDYGIYNYDGNPSIFYNDVWNNGVSGVSNYYGVSGVTLDISQDPLYRSTSGVSDYRLQAGSPCIDAGPLDSGDPVTDDLWGTPRPQGSGYDMGCFEMTAAYHVNPTKGTDDPIHGTSTGFGAWKSLHYAINQINSGTPGAYKLNLAAGVYDISSEEDSGVTLTQGNVLIRGPSTGSRAILDGSGSSAWDVGIIVDSCENVTIQNLKIRNFDSGSEIAAGIGVWNCSPTIKKNMLQGNKAGVAIYSTYQEASPIVKNNFIHSSSVAGITINTSDITGAKTNPVILHNTIQSSYYAGIGIY
ncbi:MAG: right-handed parallel beta-helix repeat-containing protein, partial [Deltaproteobacteria bacterium]|nr:right-handed parallel beta-helix repeat-containing protein [Deltaproteobacteria bacterium]